MFRDRREAGRKPAERLRALEAPLDRIVRKVGTPEHEDQAATQSPPKPGS